MGVCVRAWFLFVLVRILAHVTGDPGASVRLEYVEALGRI